MLPTEKWELGKQFSIKRKSIWKIINYAWIVFVFALCIMGIVFVKNLFFPQKSDNINQPAIHVEKGGTSHYTVIQKTEEDKPWWMPKPFVEIFGEKIDREKGFRAGGRVGVRWEF